MMLDNSSGTGLRFPDPKRVDLHVHTLASSVAGEAALNAIDCPECFSTPDDVVKQARLRGMDFVCITDHDTLDGALSLGPQSDLIVGEELTVRFPEDRCCFHLLLYGIDITHHQMLENLRDDVYQVADYVEKHRIAHSVAHPLYRQNDRLTRWHLERLLLLFKGFEVLNGAHSPLHRENIESVLNNLTRQQIAELADAHKMIPKWPEPWFKTRTAGSDDHGLLNIGRTWTEFPGEVTSVSEILECLRTGACQPGGEAGSSIKLAHQFYSVGVKYYSRKRVDRSCRSDPSQIVWSLLAGENQQKVSKLHWFGFNFRHKFQSLTRSIGLARSHPSSAPASGATFLSQAFLNSVRKNLARYPGMTQMLQQGLPPLAAHQDVFELISDINRDLVQTITDTACRQFNNGSILSLFDALSRIVAQQFFLWPYYFALFHQNKERPWMNQLTRMNPDLRPHTLRVGLFTDTLDEINGVARFIRDMAHQAGLRGYHLTVHTSVPELKYTVPGRVNFKPLLSRPMPFYPNLTLNIPPALEIMEYADRQQYDIIHCSTPGPMGLCGWLVSRMLRVPLATTYHTDFPSYIEHLTGDHRFVQITRSFMKWFYSGASVVFSRSQGYKNILKNLGCPETSLKSIIPGINTDIFKPTDRMSSEHPSPDRPNRYRLLYIGRISVEKNLPFLVQVYKQLCMERQDVELIVAGEGPYASEMRQSLDGLPVCFTGPLTDEQLVPLYNSCDLFLFPSRTDTLGQVVMEAQASGLPAIVSDQGGPCEIVVHDLTGLVLPVDHPQLWVDAIQRILDCPEQRERFGRIAVSRSARYSLSNTFDAFWMEHFRVLRPESEPVAPIHLPAGSRQTVSV